MSDISLYYSYNDDGLKCEIERLNKEAGRAEAYLAFARTDQGKFFVESLRMELNHIKSQFVNIDPTSENATVLLSSVQAYQRQAQDWLDKLSRSESYMKDASEIASQLSDVLKRRGEVRKRADNQLVPTPLKQKMKEQ